MKMDNDVLIFLSIVLSVLLLSYDITPAFADVLVQVITPTGGALSPASDCSGIGAGNHIIWMDCNDVLYAINEDTNAVLANSSVSAPSAVIFATVSGKSSLNVDVTANTVSKYTYDSVANTVSLTGIFTPTSCDLIGRDSFQYDTLGFVWTVCNSEDKIVRFNPSTMTQVSTSQDLTDGAGLECGSITKVAYSPQDNVGVLTCALPSQRIVTFTQSTTTTVTLLDDEIAANIGNEALMIDVNFNRIFAVDGTDFEVFAYTSGGIMSPQNTITGNTFAQCVNEPYLTNGAAAFSTVTVCMINLGASVSITGFASNSSFVAQILNTNAATTSASDITLRFVDNQSPFTVVNSIFYINSNSNNERYVKITGLTGTSGGDPEPPSGGGGGGGTGGVDCTLPANAQKLICRLGGDGSVGSGGDFIEEGMADIICSTGLVDCTENDDIKTNGIGLMLTSIALAIMVGVMWVASRGDLGSVPIYIWFIASLGIVGFAVLAEWIDVTFLIVAIVAIVALATAKVRGLFGGEFK